jgi:putative redox protein
MSSITITYSGDLHCEAKHESSGSVIQTDAPKDNHGKGEAFSPTDLLVASYATCVLSIMAISARHSNVDMTGATATIEKTMSKDMPRRIAVLALTISIPVQASPKARQELEKAAYNCPVHHSLHPDIEKTITFDWV